MDIVLGVSMTPTTVRMVLVEGEKADGLTVDHDVFEVASEEGSATASDQVVTAILGTRESATEGGHRLVSTGVTWRDHDEAAALRDALAEHDIDGVMLVSELHAAGALAQAAGRAVGYDRTALMFLERDTATLSVVETSDGSIVNVQSRDLHAEDAVAELSAMVAGLEDLDAPPQGVFVVGSGVSVAAIKLQLDSATSLPVSAPDEAELALARGAALASATAPLFEATTVGRAYAQDAEDTQVAGAGYMQAPAALAYSEVIDVGAPEPQFEPSGAVPEPEQQGRKPFLLVGSALTSIFVIGVTALVISLAVSIRPTVDQRPSPGENVIVPTREAPAPAPVTPEAAVPPPAPAPPPETITAPKPVVQEAPQPQAPRTVFVEAPAPAPAAPAPAPAPAAPAPAPAPAAPAPVPVPIAPPPVYNPVPVRPYVPPIVVLPRPQLPILRPWDPPRRNDDDGPRQWPQQQQPQQQWPQWPQQQQPQQQQQWPQQQWPQQQEQRDRGSDSDDWDPPRRGSDSDDGDSGSDESPLWPWPSFGRN